MTLTLFAFLRRAMRALPGALGVLALAAPAHAGGAAPPPAAAGWVTAWESPGQSIPQGAQVPTYRKAPALRDQTLRQLIVPELSGRELRVRISNRWSDTALRIDAASIGAARRGAGVWPATLRTLYFAGRTQVVVAPHGVVWSDVTQEPVRAGRALAVSLYLASSVVPRGWHRWGGQVQFVSALGNHVDDAGGGAFPGRLTSYLWLDRVDVLPRTPSAALVAIGDSITDGMRSRLDARQSWPQQLGALLRARGVHDLAVLNAGISGNRLLADSACWGEALRRRFARDALQVAGVRAVIVLIGINDIEFGYTPQRRGLDCDAPHLRPDAAQLEQALQLLARQAHARGVRLYAATLTPADLPAARESLRLQLNRWIRHSPEFDGVVDFDAALRDPRHPSRLRARFDSGDHEHPSDAGYAAMARAALGVAVREAAWSSASQLRASASSASSTGASCSPRGVSP